VPCGPIYNMDEVFADAQVKHLSMAAPVHHPQLGDIEVVNQAVELSRTPSGVRYPTPAKGEHTDEVLGELGFEAAAIAELRKQRVV
jgi:crotonobetainyl-CoA:carnitine CoA-transferase CaiB-like acyl-CoA transferase